jgi:hypothetical protein
MTTDSVVPEGVDLRSLRPGSLIDVETKSRHYHIECLGGDAIRISGHPEYCPQPVPAHLRGAIDKKGDVESGVIEPGMRLLLLLNDDHPITTSRVVSVHVKRTCGPAPGRSARVFLSVHQDPRRLVA